MVETIRQSLSAHRLAQYVMRGRCERYLRLLLFPAEARGLRERYGVKAEALSPLLSQSGLTFERDWVDQLAARERVLDLQNRSAAAFISELASQPQGRTYYYQPTFEGEIGGWPCGGRADLIEIDRSEDGTVSGKVIDIKASRRETVGFRLQVAFYARLLKDVLAKIGMRPAAVEGAIAARDSRPAADGFQTFDLSLYLDEIERLVAHENSDVARLARTPLEAARYSLGPHCDGCPYNAICFVDTAEREDLSLVPLISATEKNALQAQGVHTARQLATLMVYGHRAMEPAAGREAEVERIARRWPLGSRLPILAQRARAALRRGDRNIESRSHLLGAEYGTMPDDAEYPDLIKVFVDAHHDYIEDRIYLLAGLAVGPGGQEEVCEMAAGPPDTEDERRLLTTWVRRMLPAIARVADRDRAPLHIYLYDRGGQRALLDALARHFEALCAIPAFYDLLTSSPALSQGMLTFLAEDVRSRSNLGVICQNLYRTAAEMGFKWRETDLTRVFRARLFDSYRAFERDARTGRFRPAPADAKSKVWVEAAARFGVSIPLEYAYAAWGRLPGAADAKDRARDSLREFAGVTMSHIEELARYRCKALHHIERAFKYKNRQIRKEALDLSRLGDVQVDPATVPLRRSLENFLRLEHHAAFQEKLLHYALPPDLRSETGRSAILRCESCEKVDGEERAAFRFVDMNGAPASVADMALLRFREGDWMVLNPLRDGENRFLSGWRLIGGRLAVVESIDPEGLSLRLLSMNFRDSAFRYRHRIFSPQAGAIYTLDEMADDLNADKYLEAVRHAESSHVYRWIADPESGRRPRVIRPSRLRAGRELAALASEIQAPNGLTAAQRAVVGDYFADRVLVLQGPPGTGKSHTLGYAVLSRALALASQARPFRVAVAARTHAATTVALESIAKRAKEFLAAARDPRLGLLEQLRVVKVCSDLSENLPEGVEAVRADGDEGVKATEQWAALLDQPILVLGGTPGGLYQIVKKGGSGGRGIDWAQELFDLVVVDEASQMGLAEVLTAAAFLREDGQFIAIGDHRQMPPILAHAWDKDSRREMQYVQPHLSVFDYLRRQGFQSAALDESFRIPAEVAAFLHRHVYAEDGVEFRSRNRERLPEVAGLDGWLKAVFAREHPVILVEHDEAASQQANSFEASLVGRIARVAADRLGLDAAKGIGVVVPHRAQKALLCEQLPELAGSVDTVERFQGGERDLIIVSATVSDRDYAQLESDFLLEPRRLTVAISRPRRKLVVVASRTVFEIIPGDLDAYERGALWKRLRHECGDNLLWEGELEGHGLRVFAQK